MLLLCSVLLLILAILTADPSSGHAGPLLFPPTSPRDNQANEERKTAHKEDSARHDSVRPASVVITSLSCSFEWPATTDAVHQRQRPNKGRRYHGLHVCIYMYAYPNWTLRLSTAAAAKLTKRSVCVLVFFFFFSGAVTEEGYESTGQALTRLIGIDFTSLSPILLLCLFLLLRRSGPVHLCPPPPPPPPSHIGQCVFLVTAFHQQRAGWGGSEDRRCNYAQVPPVLKFCFFTKGLFVYNYIQLNSLSLSHTHTHTRGLYPKKLSALERIWTRFHNQVGHRGVYHEEPPVSSALTLYVTNHQPLCTKNRPCVMR